MLVRSSRRVVVVEYGNDVDADDDDTDDDGDGDDGSWWQYDDDDDVRLGGEVTQTI